MRKIRFSEYLLLVLKGALVGFGAILPGVSGGTLCVAFGMYRPILNLLSHPFKTLKKNGFSLLAFILGGIVGFVGLAGVADWLMGINENAVICVFVGFVLGTVPDLWRTAGGKRRNASAYLSVAISFAALLGIMTLVQTASGINVQPDFAGFLLCGVFWGLSFIVPGMSSSTLIIFFGLYQQMTEGISTLNFGVLIPLAIGAGGCMILLSRPTNWLFGRFYSIMSHAIIGFMLASTVMVIPYGIFSTAAGVITAVLCIIGGTVTSYALGVICNKLPQKY